jgi:hypothetical protein
MAKVNHQEIVTELYTKTYKPLGLAPAHVTQLKGVLEKASKKNAGDKAAIKAAAKEWLKEKGISSKPKSEEPPVKVTKGKSDDADGGGKKPKKGAAPEPEKVPAKKTVTPVESGAVKFLRTHEGGKAALKGDPLKGVPAGNIDMTKLDRKSLKGMAKDLNVTYSKEDSDDELRSKVSAAMTGLDKKAVELLDKADPQKVHGEKGLKDCIGLFIDLTRATCITCPAQKQCRDLFQAHKDGGFEVFKNLLATSGVKEERIADEDEEPEAVEEKPKKGKKSKKLTYNPTRKVEVYDIGKLKDVLPKLDPVTVMGIEIEDHVEHRPMLLAVKKAYGAGDIDTWEDLSKVITEHVEPEDDSEEALETVIVFFTEYMRAIEMVELV